MKIKRLFAAILTALMVVSAFSFTASAQDTQTVTNPVATVQTAKADHGTYRNDNHALTKTKLYDAVSDKIFYRCTPDAAYPTATTRFDAHGLPAINTVSGTIYMAMDVRSNYSVSPYVLTYNTTKIDDAGSNPHGGTYTAAASKGDGKWERVIIKISHENLKSFTQVHFYVLGGAYNAVNKAPADLVLDIAAFGFFKDEYSAKNYNFGTAIAADGNVSFSVDGEVLDEVPTADPVVDGKVFVGWNANKDATKGEELTELTTVPDKDTTYYAVLTGTIQDERAVYIAANGNDANNGRHSKTPVKTLAKANELLKGEGIDTLYVVGNVDGTGTPGISNKKIYIKGYSGKGTEIISHTGHWKFGGDVEFEDIVLYDSDGGDGQFAVMGYDIVVNDSVTTQTSSYISQAYYNSPKDIDSVIDLNGGKWTLYLGVFSGGTVTGKTVWNIGGKANITGFKLGHNDVSTTNGSTYVNINGGTIGPVSLNRSNGNNSTAHNGLRYFTFNGGTTESVYTRAEAKDKVSLTGITVFEFNEGATLTAKSIPETAGETDDTEERVVIFNDGFDAVPVGDTGAIVADVTGGNLHADVTVASDYKATLNGFKYDLAANYYNTVKIGDDEYALTEFVNGLIPASAFAAGVNTVEFYEVTNVAQKVVYVSANGSDANKGDTADAPVKTLKKVRELLDAEDSAVEKVYIIGTVELTEGDTSNQGKKSYAIGAAGRKVTYLGYGENAILDAKLMPVYLVGEVEIDNFLFQQHTTWDGKFMTEGHNLTVGENMTFAGHTENPNPFTYGGTSTVLTNFYYALKGNVSGGIPTPLVNTITLNGGSINSFRPAIYSGEATFKGEVTVNLNKNSAVNGMSLNGQGYENTINTYGTIIVNVNDNAKVTTISSEVGGNSIGNYSGLREININGGNVGTINTTAKGSQVVKNSDGSVKKTLTATKREQLMVITVNGGTLGKVTKPNDDETENSTVALIFNDGVAPVTYTDKDAYILDVTGGDVEAITTVSEDYTTATLGGFTYESADDIYDAIKITANGTAKTYKFTDLDGEISLDKLTKGAVNTLEFVNSNEAEHIKAYRDAGYEIIYVAGNKLKTSVASNTAAGKKVVFALKDDLNLSGAYSLDNNGGTFVITSAGGNINLGVYSIALGTDKDADITFDHIALSKTTGERGINAVGNNLTLTETVTVSSGDSTIFYVNADADGGNASKGNTVTIETPSKVSVRGAGWSGNFTKGDVNFVFGKNAQAYLTAAGKVGNTNQPDTKGNITVTVKDNAKLLEFTLAEGKSFLSGNLDVTIKDNAAVNVLKIANAVTGNATINIQSGTVGDITITDGKVTGRSSVIVDTDKATVGTITGAKYAIKFNGNLGKATPSADYATIALTPAATAKYVRVTNGDTVKEYNVAGEEVDLLADLSALALAEGATTVEFLADGTEAPKTATLKFYENIVPGEPEPWVTKTVAIGATLDILPLMSDVKGGNHATYTNDILARPNNKGYKLVGWATTADGEPVTVTATADAVYYAVWEEVNELTAGEDFTLTIVDGTEVTASPVPANAISFIRGDDKNSFGVNSDGVKYYDTTVTDLSAYGVSFVAGKTTIGSWYGGSDTQKTVLCPDGTKSIWYKWNDSYLSAKPGVEGEYNVAYWIYTGSEGSTRAFTLDAPGKSGVVYFDGAGNKDHFVQFKANLTADSELKYCAALDFDDNAVKGAQLLGIYIWKDAPVVTTANATFNANGGAWGEETTKTVVTTIGETPVAPEAPVYAGYVFKGWTPELKAMDADGETYTAVWEQEAPKTANATFDANGGKFADGETTKTVVTNIGETPVAPEAPAKADYTFAGWEPTLAAMVAEGATYKAKWTATPRAFENAVYIDTTGADSNDGLTPEKPVKTLAGAQKVFEANKTLDTLVVVGTYSKSDEGTKATDANVNTFGKNLGRKITITGYTVESVFDMRFILDGSTKDSHFRIYTDIEFNNINIIGSSKDGGIMSMGYELTLGENIKITSGSQNLGILHYNAQYKDNAVVNVLSGKYNKVDLAVQSGQTYKGTSTINIGGTAETRITNGHGWKGTQAVYGINNINVNGGKVSSIQLSATADTAVTNYSGLRYFTINAGTVGDIYTTGSSVSKKYAKLDSNNKEVKDENGNTIMLEQTASYRAGVTVVEYNGGTIGTIKVGTNKQTGAADPDNATRVVILNNDMTATVEDTGAIVVKAIGAKLHAATNAQETYPNDYTTISGDWGKAVVLKGFTYELPEGSTANAVKIDGGEAVLLADFADGVIRGITNPGTHTVEFVYSAPAVVNTKIYLSAGGNDEANGTTADTAVKTLPKALELIAADENLNTLVIVGTFTTAQDNEILGVAGKTITVTGADANATFNYDARTTSGSDDDIVLAGPVIFKNIKIRDGSGDGVIRASGHKIVFDEGVTHSVETIEVAAFSGNPNEIHIKSGSFGRVLPGPVSGSYAGTTNITVDGGTISSIVLGHGWRDQAKIEGTINVTVNGGNVNLISLNSNGDGAAVAYRGLRYYTLNGGTVGNIHTTEGSQYLDNGNPRKGQPVSFREGTTVFEINNAGIVTGNILTGNNVVTNLPEADKATRIILFNNNSYAEGIVTDTGAITVNVKDGALKADVTVGDAASGYKTTLNGYTFTTDKKYVIINGKKYDATEFASDAGLEAEEVSGVIPADKLVAGYNTVTFADVEMVTIKFVVNGVETTAEYEVGAAVEFITATLPASTKDVYYTFKAWNDGTADVDTEAYTAPAGGATLTAVFSENAMPASAVKEFDRVYAMNNGKEFSSVMETIDGVEAAKAVYSTDTAEHNDTLTFEGWNGWPTNHSVVGNVNFVDTSIYNYAVVRYYYVPGTNTTARNLTLRTMGNVKELKAAMEENKWTYVVYDLTPAAGAATVSNQYHLRAMEGIKIAELVANNEIIYVDTMTVFKSAPTVATVTFKNEDGAVLYAIDALNGEAVAYNGAAVEKADYTFKGWAIEGTTEIIDTFAFTQDTTLVPVFEKNVELIDVKWIVDGEEVKAENVEAGTAVTAPDAPAKDGYTFKGWAIEGTTDIIDTFAFTTSTTLVAIFEEITAEPEATAYYKTYGEYDSEAGTYTVELKFVGAQAHIGSFGFVLPGLVSVTAAEGVTLFSEEGATVSPIFAKGEDFYANTWAIEQNPGYIDATTEEVLIATFVLKANASFPEKFEKYVVENADAKYYNGTNYLVAPKTDSLATDKIAVVYDEHEDSIKEVIVTADYEYKTYGNYNPVTGDYTIDVTYKGGMVNAGAFGIAFNDEYITFDPEADNALVLAEGIGNYLGIELAMSEDGVAFVWDGSENDLGYIDATEEILIATIAATMTDEQRAAYEAAGTPAFELLDIADVDDAEKYVDDEGNYLVTLYEDGLDVERAATAYTTHTDSELEITTADVKVIVTFADKDGETVSNIGYITKDLDEPVVIDDIGNTEATLEYVFEDAEVGDTFVIKVSKNGYVTAFEEVTVSAAGNVVEITVLGGDIKESTTAICGDGTVDLSDFIRVVRAFDDAATEEYESTVDINEDGTVTVADLAIVKANFGTVSGSNLK